MKWTYAYLKNSFWSTFIGRGASNKKALISEAIEVNYKNIDQPVQVKIIVPLSLRVTKYLPDNLKNKHILNTNIKENKTSSVWNMKVVPVETTKKQPIYDNSKEVAEEAINKENANAHVTEAYNKGLYMCAGVDNAGQEITISESLHKKFINSEAIDHIVDKYS